jgi:hypothetical protein
MRAPRKTWAACLLLLLAAVFLPWGVKRLSSTPREENAASQPAPRAAATRRPPAKLLAADPSLPAPRLSPYPSGSEEHRAWLKDRGEALMDLSWNDDKESLDGILAELSNPDPEIRAAALAATLNFGSRDAIPRLEALALATDDTLERKKLQDAAAHLKLPTLTEMLAKRKKTEVK